RHVVQALGAVRRGVDRAHVLAGSFLAVLAREGLNGDLRIVLVVADEVTIEAKPGHLAALLDAALADRGDVVLGLAGHDAGVASAAGGEVERHAPAMANLRE